LLLRFVGVFLLRFAARTFDALLLFQQPPRLTKAACPGTNEPTMPEQEDTSLESLVEHALSDVVVAR
jgi:hypothetical protein